MASRHFFILLNFNINMLLFVAIIPIIVANVHCTNCIGEERDLKGKVVVITGAAQGIGLAIADNFLKQAIKLVILLDINRDKGIKAEVQLNKQYGEDKAVFIECDVTKDLEDVAGEIFEQYGDVNVLVNNAGIADEYNGRKTIMTNALATMEWSVKFWNHMRTDKGGCGGTIINMSADFGYYIHPFFLYYKSAASATISFSKGLGHEYNYKKTGVRVLVLCPGYIYTELTKRQYVWDEEVVDYNRMLEHVPRKSTDDVGKDSVQVFKTARSGTAWAIIGGEPPVEAPNSVTVTLADIMDF